MDFLGYTTVKAFVCAQLQNLQLGLTAGYRGAAFENFGISPCWFTNAYSYNEPFRFSSPSASRTSAPKAAKTFHSKGAPEIQ